MARARNSRSDKTLDAVLKEVERLKRRAEELRGWRALAIRGPIGAIGSWPGPGPYSGRGYTPDEIAALDGTAEYVAECDAGIAEVEARIAEAWSLAGGLQDAPDRLAGDDSEIAEQAAALDTRIHALEATAGQRREDFHDSIDAMLGFHRERLETLLASWPLGAIEVEEAGRLWAFADPALAERLHAAVDARPESDFAQGSRATWKSEIATLRKQAERRRKELALRQQEREAREAEARRAEAEVELSQVT